MIISARAVSSVWLERCVDIAEVTGSNPVSPTQSAGEIDDPLCGGSFLIRPKIGRATISRSASGCEPPVRQSVKTPCERASERRSARMPEAFE